MSRLTDIEIDYIINNKTLEWIRQQHYDYETINRIVDKMLEVVTNHKRNEFDETILETQK